MCTRSYTKVPHNVPDAMKITPCHLCRCRQTLAHSVSINAKFMWDRLVRLRTTPSAVPHLLPSCQNLTVKYYFIWSAPMHCRLLLIPTSAPAVACIDELQLTVGCLMVSRNHIITYLNYIRITTTSVAAMIHFS
ncbi:hypothetical protein PAHAL_4G079500 [Panicum hallii]|uniref:Uncharacterized protein n=1 Tax=Panicum hallii TaxID=206008 RepID=A0A2S3HHT2_9POAL|nr:hypothetical protein PAHAL_4G079500 [Panicum hallii]